MTNELLQASDIAKEARDASGRSGLPLIAARSKQFARHAGCGCSRATAEAKAAGFEAAGAQWFDAGSLPFDEPIDPTVTAAWRRAFLERNGERALRPAPSGSN